MNNSLVIGLDLGTTTVKALAMAVDSTVAGTAAREVKLCAPQPGWATQSPRDYDHAVQEALGEVISKVEAERITGIAISGAMHSIIPISADDQPLADGMTWADRRGMDELCELRREVDTHAMHRRTGCPVRSMYHAPRLRWWRLHEDTLAKPVKRFVSMKAWIAFSLTGRWGCDRAFASTMGLLNLEQGEWDDQALKAAEVDAEQLGPLIDPQATVGMVPRALAVRLGLTQSIPVIAGSTDGPLANLGAAGGKPGPVVITVGTSGAVRRTIAVPSVDDDEQSWCYLIADGLYARGGAINNGGLAAEWAAEHYYRDLTERRRFGVMMKEAKAAGIGADGVTILPYFAGERTPIWNPAATASIHGLARRHTRGHLARAALEAVAFCLRDVWRVVVTDSPGKAGKVAHSDTPGTPVTPGVCLTGGITRSPLWCRILADVLGVTIDPCRAADGSAIGAARLGHWALGHVDHLADFAPQRCDDSIHPDEDHHRNYQVAYDRFGKLKASLH